MPERFGNDRIRRPRATDVVNEEARSAERNKRLLEHAPLGTGAHIRARGETLEILHRLGNGILRCRAVTPDEPNSTPRSRSMKLRDIDILSARYSDMKVVSRPTPGSEAEHAVPKRYARYKKGTRKP